MGKNTKIIESPFNSYFGVFLTLACSLKCDYCVQKISLPHQPPAAYPLISGKDWVEALNAIANRRKKRFFRRPKRKKISITGGEPTLHPDFVYIINNLDNDWNITVTSNFDFSHLKNTAAFLKGIKRRRDLKLNGSFHFLYTPIEKFIENTLEIKKAGVFLHSLFIVGHPGHTEEIQRYRKELLKIHPIVKVQRFLGYFRGELYPAEQMGDIEYQQQDGIFNYQVYREGYSQANRQPMYCRMNKVLFAPNADIYNCHYKLYTAGADKLGNLLESGSRLVLPEDYFLCNDYGFCNPCDSESHSYRRTDGKEFNISCAA